MVQLLACVCTTMVMAQSIGAFTLLALVISSGFAIVRGSIPGWWCVSDLLACKGLLALARQDVLARGHSQAARG